ncbi:type II secretion system protein GspD [bacterium]|nr:type II secretion system protein GspD [bacterium]MBR6302032.1 type II secretion system protein GspD [bacterium]
MKDTLKKFMSTAMLLSFALTTPVSSLALTANEDLLAYGMDYMPEIRGSQPSVVSLDTQRGITGKSQPITLSLRDSDIKQVLRMFADKAGMNIIFKGDVKGQVTMDLVNIPLNSAFDMVMASQKLTYITKDNTLIIANATDISSIGKQEMAIIPVKYVAAGQLAHFLNVNIYGMGKPGLSNSYIASTNPAANEIIIFGSDNDVKIARNVVAQLDKKPTVTSFKVNHTTPKQMAEMICGFLLLGTGFAASGDSSGGAAPISSLNDMYTSEALDGVITGAAADSDSGIELGSGVLACSSAIVNKSESSSGEDSQELVSMDSLYGLSVAYFTQLGTVNVTGATPQQIDMIREYIAKYDKRQPQAYIEFSIVELNESGTREFDNEWTFLSKHFNFNYDGDPSGGTTSSPVGFTYKFGGHRPVLSTATPQLLYTLKIIMKNGKGRTISNPRVLATNGQESVIDLSEDYVKSVKSEFIQSSVGVTANNTVQRTYEIGDDLGLKIAVTPFISPDGYVYLNVKPEYSTIKEKETYIGQTGETELGATLLARNNLDLKNIRLKDEETLVIGGLMRESEVKNTSKVPFFGDIPGLGTFFRSSVVQKEKRELIILITPKIVTDSDEPTATL